MSLDHTRTGGGRLLLKRKRDWNHRPAHDGAVTAVSFFDGGRRLVSSGMDHKLRVWDVAPSSSSSLPSATGVHFAGFSNPFATQPSSPMLVLLNL